MSTTTVQQANTQNRSDVAKALKALDVVYWRLGSIVKMLAIHDCDDGVYSIGADTKMAAEVLDSTRDMLFKAIDSIKESETK